jgi:manganese/iron transport system ATP-binding protein
VNRQPGETGAGVAPTPSIVVAGVTVRYTNGVTAVNDASFALGPGTICALVGINGSGKSTLFKALMGFLKPAKGMVSIAGMEVQRALKRGLVAYVPQAEDVDWSFPVLVDDVVMMGRYGHMSLLRLARKADRDAVEDALARVNMLEFRRRQIGELSGGQRKRVFLARALAQGGQVILLDEPFTGVDVKTEDAIVGLMRELRDEGRLMLVSTHNLGSIPDFCDQVVTHQQDRAGGRADRDHLHAGQSQPRLRRRAQPFPAGGPRSARRCRRASGHRHHRRRASARALWRTRPREACGRQDRGPDRSS